MRCLCDANLNIICVDPSMPGSAHDSNVWQSHPLSSHLTELSTNGEQLYLLGKKQIITYLPSLIVGFKNLLNWFFRIY